jgi:glycosyltransferase involved in cell wall biosynthesis
MTTVLLTNYIPPYRLPLFRALAGELGTFKVLESVPMSPERPWIAEYEGLSVEIQKTLTFQRVWKHPLGFRDRIYVHVPYDTLSQLQRLEPDVLLSSELGARTGQALAYRLSHPTSRLIMWTGLSEHSEGGRGYARQMFRRALLPFADAVLVNGASGARYVKRFGVRDEKIFVTLYATDHAPFLALSLDRSPVEQRRLLYLGQLTERKGLFPFLGVLSHWCRQHRTSEVEFWLVGGGPEMEKLRSIAVPPNLKLCFCGSFAHDHIPAFCAQSGILAFPTFTDEWGVVVNEAMAAGLPVLGSVYSQAVEEMVQDGLTGWTFRPDRAQEMYEALDRALSAPLDRLQSMRAAARKRAGCITSEFVADRVMDAIRFVRRDKRRCASVVADESLRGRH